MDIEYLDKLFDENLPESMDIEVYGNAKFNKSYEDSTSSKFKERVSELLNIESINIGERVKGKYFNLESVKGKENELLILEISGLKKTIFDPNIYDISGLSSITDFSVSGDGDRVALLIDSNGDESKELIVIDCNGSIIDRSPFKVFASGLLWDFADNGIYYNYNLGKSKNLNEFKNLMYHKISQSWSDDKIIFEGNINSYLSLDADRESKYFVLTVREGLEYRQDMYVAKYNGVNAELDFKKFVSRDTEGEIECYIKESGNLYLLGFNRDVFGEITLFNIDNILDGVELFSDLDKYKLVDGGSNPITSIHVDEIRRELYVIKSANAVSKIFKYNLNNTNFFKEISLNDFTVIDSYLISHSDDDNLIYFTASNFLNPRSVYALNKSTEKVELTKVSNSFLSKRELTTRELKFETHDGYQAYGYLLLPEDYKEGEPRKTIIYGYGGFAISEAPEFGISPLAWVEEGNIWASVQLRGGNEQGENWHKMGMREHKENTFKDLYSFASRLVELGYSNYSSLGFRGGSNGGLTAGVAVVQKPEIFGAVVSECGLLDMLNFHKFSMGITWLSEYGDPRISEEREWISSYSPLHNVKSMVEYPNTLIVNYKNDSRVDNMHGRRFFYALESNAVKPDKIHLITIENTGHIGGNISQETDMKCKLLDFFDKNLKV